VKGFLNGLLALGPAGVFLFAILDGAGVPTPGGLDALLIFLSAEKPEAAYLMAALTLVGSLIGCFILFYIARRGGELYLAKYTASGRGARFKTWFRHYGLLTVFIPALVPIPMPLKVFVICAGALGISPWAYLRVLLAARIPRYFALAYLGSQLGTQSWRWLTAHALHFAAFAVVLFVFLYLLVKYVDYRRGQRLIAPE
jgi:membrane protein YqaA with SNARE-associated domain